MNSPELERLEFSNFAFRISRLSWFRERLASPWDSSDIPSPSRFSRSAIADSLSMALRSLSCFDSSWWIFSPVVVYVDEGKQSLVCVSEVFKEPCKVLAAEVEDVDEESLVRGYGTITSGMVWISSGDVCELDIESCAFEDCWEAMIEVLAFPKVYYTAQLGKWDEGIVIWCFTYMSKSQIRLGEVLGR